MDAPIEHKDLIERLLTEEARVPVSYGEITLYTVFDRAQDHYLLMAVGWDGHKRVHAPLIHVAALGKATPTQPQQIDSRVRPR